MSPASDDRCCPGKSALAYLDDRVAVYLAISAILSCVARKTHVRRNDEARWGLNGNETHAYVHMHTHICTQHTATWICTRTFVPSLHFRRVSSVALSRNAHVSYAFTIESARSRFEGQMALKSVYNFSRNSAPDWRSKTEYPIKREGYDKKSRVLKKGTGRTWANESW